MNYLTKLRWVGMGCAMMAMTSTLLAVPVSVTSRAALTGNDSINWPGEEYDALGAAFNTSSAGGLGVSVSGATESFGGFERADQSSSWNGNFAPGDRLLWTGFGFAPQIMMFEFANPVFGAGAQIQNDFLQGAFTALLTAYDSGGVVIHSDTFAGNSTDNADNSAIFIGVLNNVENIAKLELSVEGSESYAINQMSINRTRSQTVPESGEYLTLMMVLSLFAMHLMFRERRVTA